MNEVKIPFKQGTLTILEREGKIDIVFSKELLKKTRITVMNAGLPGIIGPHIDFELEEIIEKKKKEAIELIETRDS